MPTPRLLRCLGLACVGLTSLVAEHVAGDETGASTAPATAATVPALTDDNVDHWRAFIRPDADELRWRVIPWRTSLWQAVLDAQERRQPILLWAMNGHPMGCT